MGRKEKDIVEHMRHLPMLSEALEHRKQVRRCSDGEEEVSPLHDALFVRDVLMTDEGLEVHGEYTVVSPVHTLSVRVDLYEETGSEKILIKEGITAVAFGGACKVIGDVSITREEGYGKRILAVLTGDQYTEEENTGAVNVLEDSLEVEIGTYETDRQMLESIQVDDPVSKQDPPREYIYICYNRKVKAKETEDYFVPEGGGENFYIPLKGTAYFHDVNSWFDEVVPPDSAADGRVKSELRIFMRDGAGGEVTYQNTSANFINSFHPVALRKDGNVIRRGFSWDFGTIPWVTRSPFVKSTTHDMDFEFKVAYKLRNDPDREYVMTINSYQELQADYQKVGFMRIYWGCLYLGTKITMSDGTKKRIETLKPGDMVKSRDRALRVKDIVEGREPRGVLLIETESRKVYVSDNHPMVTTQGMILASELIYRCDISIYTEDGDEERLEDVNRYVFQDDRVYSLILEAEDGSKLPAEEHVFYANGLLTGDNDAQKYATEIWQQRERQRFALGRHWRRDVEAAKKYCKLYNEGDILWKEK